MSEDPRPNDGPISLPSANDRQVPLPIRLAYGAGSIADGTKNAGFNAFLVLYYTTVLGLPGTLSGLAIFIALCVDAVTDPLVGSISDHFRSRFGRRHPFMYFAAVPMGLCFYGLFAPPAGLGETQLFLWLTGFAIGVRLFLTFYMVPSGALGPEMTTSYDERTRLVAYRWLLGWLGALTLLMMGWLVFLADRDVLGDGRLDAANYPQLGLFAGIVVTLAILVSSAGTHSVIPRLRQVGESEGPVFSLRRFLADASAALRNHSLRMLLGSSLFTAAALGVGEVLGTYMNTWFWEFSSQQIGLLAAAQVLPLILGFSMVGVVSRRWDKRKAAIGLSLFAILWLPLPVLMRLVDLAPANGSAYLLPFIVFHLLFLIGAAIQIGILNSSMVMDATDEHELESGERREGTFIAVTTFTGKATSGFGNFLGGAALDWIDFPQGQEATVGSVPEETIFRLGLIAGPGLTFFYLCGLWFITRLRLSRERYAQISRELAARRESGV